MLLLELADAQDALDALREDLERLGVDHFVAVAEDRAALRVARQDVVAAHALEHGGRGGTGEGSGVSLSIAVLRAEADLGALERVLDGREVRERRADGHAAGRRLRRLP